MANSGEVILRVDNLVKHFPITQGILFKKKIGAVKAVDGVSFELHRGETLGIVGESGCGKSTLAKLLMRLEEPTTGRAVLKGRNIFQMGGSELRRLRRNVQMVMQDPYTSLNPRLTVGDIIGEPFEIHTEVAPRGDRQRRVQELLELVGLNPEHINRYPHQFSGGQRQRIGIARALALKPEIIVCDEPVSALDVSIQAQVVNLLEDLQKEFHLTYVFIAHDLSVVRHVSNRVAVMYLGKVVELSDARRLYTEPKHPYSGALLSAVPIPDPDRIHERQRVILLGDVPSPIDPPSGCRFHPRCPKAQQRCVEEVPPLERKASGDLAACHFPIEPGENLAEARPGIRQETTTVPAAGT
jgi:oligopeptide/dipeptide ABC transporter ATP-binding protein